MMTKTYIPIWELPMSSAGAELFTGGTGVTMSFDGGAGEILMDADASNTPYGELALPDGDPTVFSRHSFSEGGSKRLAVEAMLGVSGSGAPAILKVMQNDGTNDIELGQTTVTLSESVTLDVTSVSNNDPFVVVMQGDVGAQVRIPLLGYKEIDDVVHDVVMMECNDDEFGTDYRFGFNGMTKDNNLKGIGNSLDFGARIQDSRLGRWFSIDKKSHLQPSWSPYKFGYDNPIFFKDADGNFEVTPEFARTYPKVTMILMNADKLYYNKPLPPEVERAFEGTDVKKYFNDNFRTAFEKYSTLNKQQIDETLSPNKGPLITSQELDYDKNKDNIIDDNDKVNGRVLTQYNSKGKLDNHLHDNGRKGWLVIDNDIVEVLEYELSGKVPDDAIGFGGVSPSEEDKAKALVGFISTVFHEGVHFGRFFTGAGNRSSEGEKGKQFEEDAFGEDKSRIEKNDLKKSSE